MNDINAAKFRFHYHDQHIRTCAFELMGNLSRKIQTANITHVNGINAKLSLVITKLWYVKYEQLGYIVFTLYENSIKLRLKAN